MIRDEEAWGLYEKVKSQHDLTGIFEKTDKYHAFYEGDQWRGIESGGEALPVLNVIKPVVDQKVATVAQNKLTVALNPIDMGEDYASAKVICDKLTEYMAMMWEQHKMDDRLWKICKDAAIAGDSYLFFYDGQASSQILDRTQIFLSDEQNTNIQEQKFIIIKERRFVSDIKSDAEKNGIKKSEIDAITGDSDTKEELGTESDKEVRSSRSEKATSILMLWKDENGIVCKCRACSSCVYERETPTGLTIYPIASYIWNEKKGSARGIGEVEMLLTNQIEINRQMARMIMSSKLTSFPKLAYRAGSIQNPKQLESVGGAVEVDDVSVSKIGDMIAYLQPAGMAGDAYTIWQNLFARTKELAGASDAFLGQIDPSTASGTAIIAVKSQAAMSLNSQMSAYKQFVEDVAAIWWDIWVTYNPDGLTVTLEGENGQPVRELVTPQTMSALKISTRIDVSPDSPFDRYAQEQSIERTLVSGLITFDEYVMALDSNSAAPKAKFEAILAHRRAQAQAQQEAQMKMQMQMQQAQQEAQIQQGAQVQAQQETGQEAVSGEQPDSMSSQMALQQILGGTGEQQM